LRRELCLCYHLIICEYTGDKETKNKKALIEKKGKEK